MSKTIILPINLKCKIITFQNKQIIVFYTSYFLIHLFFFKYNKYNHTLNYIDHYNLPKNYSKTLQYFFNQLTTIFLKKIYFQGKGYKIRKIKDFNFIEFFFGYCHFTIINFLFYKLKLRKKWSFLLYYTSKAWLHYRLNFLIKLKKWNIYTWRGLRVKKNLIFKKPKRKATFI